MWQFEWVLWVHKGFNRPGPGFRCARFLQAVQQQLLVAFAARMRQGHYGKGCKVQSQTPKTTLRHVAQTLVLAGYADPRWSYAGNNLDLPFSRLNKSYKNEDPAPQPQLTLPVRAVQDVVQHYHQEGTALGAAIADLTVIAFFFLLCPGEYTMASARKLTWTVQFWWMDIRFFRYGQIVPHSALLAAVCKARASAFTLTTRKTVSMEVWCTTRQYPGIFAPSKCSPASRAPALYHWSSGCHTAA
jgi:hypothetical protein